MALAVAAVTFVVLLSAHAAAAIQKTNLRCEAVLREQNSLFEAAVHHLPMGLSMFDGEQRLIMCNPAYRALYDLTDELAPAGEQASQISFSITLGVQDGSDDGTHLDNARIWITEHLSKLKLGNKITETIHLRDGRCIFQKSGTYHRRWMGRCSGRCDGNSPVRR